MRTRAALIASVLGPALFAAGPGHALSLRSSAAEIFLGDVRPGKVVVASVNGPLSVENSGGEKALVDVSTELSPPERLKEGYDPLPDSIMRVVEKSASRWLEPGERRELGLKVVIPRDQSLEGGQYQFDCLLKGRNTGGSELKMRTAVMLAVGPGDPPDISREPEDSGFSVSPAKAHLEGIPLGRRALVRSEKFRGLKLANAGESEVVVRMTSVRAWDESMRIEDGYVPAANPHWLKTDGVIRIKPGEVALTTMTLQIPRQARYRGRNWAFVVAVDVQSAGRSGRTWWTLYVRTQDEEESRIR